MTKNQAFRADFASKRSFSGKSAEASTQICAKKPSIYAVAAYYIVFLFMKYSFL